MVKYRVFINKDLCIDCGIETGRCPTHARTLARILANNRVNKSKDVFMAVIPEDLYHIVKQVSENCPVKAIIVEKLVE
jgi:ferredoxin